MWQTLWIDIMHCAFSQIYEQLMINTIWFIIDDALANLNIIFALFLLWNAPQWNAFTINCFAHDKCDITASKSHSSLWFLQFDLNLNMYLAELSYHFFMMRNSLLAYMPNIGSRTSESIHMIRLILIYMFLSIYY